VRVLLDRTSPDTAVRPRGFGCRLDAFLAW
jgi:hypothetical protein